MKISAAFPSKYLRAADLGGRQVTAIIDRVEIDEMTDGEPKPVVYFVNKQKAVVLNKTNANAIAAAYGDDTDEWTGGEVVLFTAMVDFQGKTTEAIRIKIPPRKRDKPAPASRPRQEETEPVERGPVDDDIPF